MKNLGARAGNPGLCRNMAVIAAQFRQNPSVDVKKGNVRS